MRTRIAAGVAATVAAGTLGLVSALPAAANNPQPLDPTTAAALAAATPAVASGSTQRAVSPAEALASASTPGATVWVAPGMSLRQAVGAVSQPSAKAAASVTTASSTPCWANAAWHQWGTWPYEQKLTDTTYWCAVYGVRITYRSSATTASGTFCGTSWRATQLIAGGIGYTWFTIRSSAQWSCPTAIPWVTLHPSHYQDVSRNARGSTSVVGTG
jgi:hypothetical protein